MRNFSSNDYIVRTKTDEPAVSYPAAVGNITITGFFDIPNTTSEPIFPIKIDYRYYFADLTFKFQRTE